MVVLHKQGALMFAVAGVSGRTGAATAEALLKQGQKVRVLVRKAEQGEPWLRHHAEVAVCDFNDTDSLIGALSGVTGAWLLLPPRLEVDARTAMLASMAKALKRARLERLAFLSCVGAQHPTGTGPATAVHQAEQLLASSAQCVTFVRAAYFLENWGALLLPALETGELPFYGHVHTKFPQVSARDVGHAAAQVLTTPVRGTRFIEVAGAENWSADDVAEVISSLLGTRIKAVERPVDSLEDPLLAEQYRAMARGVLNFAHPHQLTRGTTPLYNALKTLV